MNRGTRIRSAVMAVLFAVLLLACGGAAALAQNSVRGPVGAPVPLTFGDGQTGQTDQTGQPDQTGQTGLTDQTGQANAPAQAAAAQAAKTSAAAAAAAQGKTDAPQPKFPNKDTAKNRQDYDMGTDTGSIQLGRDEATGDTVLGHTPPKKVQQPYPMEQQPINVWPVVPGRRGR